MFEQFGKKVVEHIPEILTVGACAGVVIGDVLLVKGAKKEATDGDKKHYIPGIIVTAAGIGCIIGSNRVSNAQKVTLAGVAAVLASQNKKQREYIEDKFGDDELMKMDEKVSEETKKDASKPIIKKPSGDMKKYYLPQVGIRFEAPEISQETFERAEIAVNKFFDSDGQVSLDDILYRLGVAKYVYKVDEDRHVARNTIWAFDWDSDYPQKIVFEKKDTVIDGEKTCRIRFLQMGARNQNFQ